MGWWSDKPPLSPLLAVSQPEWSMGKPDGCHSKQQLPVVVGQTRCSPYVSLYTPEIWICMWSTCHAITDWVNGWVTDSMIWYSSVCVCLCILTRMFMSVDVNSIQFNSKYPLLLHVSINTGQQYTLDNNKCNLWNSTQCCNTPFYFFTGSVT